MIHYLQNEFKLWFQKTTNQIENEAGVAERGTNVNDEEHTSEKGRKKNEKKQGIGARRRTSKSLYNENEEGNKSFKFGS